MKPESRSFILLERTHRDRLCFDHVRVGRLTRRYSHLGRTNVVATDTPGEGHDSPKRADLGYYSDIAGSPSNHCSKHQTLGHLWPIRITQYSVIDATHAFATTMIFYLIIHPMA
jgi:hypothetical protein